MRKAFSLTEVLIAVVIIACGIVPIFFVFSRGNAGTVQTKDEILAQNYALDLLAYAQALKFDNAFLSQGRHPAKSVSLTPSNIPAVSLKMEDGFDRNLEVVDWQPDASMEWGYQYKVLTSEVTWTSKGVSRKIQMPSIIYKGKN